jgi:hypothetical protein
MELTQSIGGLALSALGQRGEVQKPMTPKSLTLEAWSSGFLAGGLIIMGCITVANMRKDVLLHKVRILKISYSCSWC